MLISKIHWDVKMDHAVNDKGLFVYKSLKIIIISSFISFVFGLCSNVLAQSNVAVDSSIEEELRQHLRKLDRWGIVQLLRTERAVDEKQKERAQATSNPDELALLAEDEDSGVRFYVASNRHVPLDVQLQLVEDAEEVVRGGVALSLRFENEDSALQAELKQRIALRLAGDSKPIVRLALASNTTLPELVYNKLAADQDPIIRQKLSENVRVPRSTLTILGRDGVATVRAEAAVHTNMPTALLAELSRDLDPFVRTAVAGNINTSVDVLDSLALDGEIPVRLAVAQHPLTSAISLDILANDADLGIQQQVAQHPRAGKELLLSLADFERDIQVRQLARKRLEPILRGEIREDVLERWVTQ